MKKRKKIALRKNEMANEEKRAKRVKKREKRRLSGAKSKF